MAEGSKRSEAHGGRFSPAFLGLIVVGLSVVAALVVLTVFLTAGGRSATSDPIIVTTSACAPGWSASGSGVVSYTVYNEAPVVIDTEFIDHANGAIVGSIKVLGPATNQPMALRLGRGTYQWKCIYNNFAPRYSKALVVTRGVRASSATPSFIPTTAAEMAGPVTQYDNYVAGKITVLQSQVATLENDVDQNNLAQAKVDWLAAELTYSGIGGTYGALGSLQAAINGLPQALPDGVNDPNFVGLHRIEYMLWSGQPAGAIAPFVADLSRSVEQLQILWSEPPVSANLLSTRAHEILEDTQRDTLSGNDDEGSNSSLERAWADLQGEQVVLGVLRGVIDRRTPKLLSVAEPELAAFGQALQDTKVNEQWVPLSSLTTAQRERLDGTIGQVLETLSRIPDLLEIQQFADAPAAT